MPSDAIVCGTGLLEIINEVCDSVHACAPLVPHRLRPPPESLENDRYGQNWQLQPRYARPATLGWASLSPAAHSPRTPAVEW